MKAIINNLLYDTDKSEILYQDLNTYPIRILYLSKNLRLFMTVGDEISNADQEELKYFLGTVNVDKYMELFGEVEEG